MPRIAILRHAPALTHGRVAGRRDVDADCSDKAAFRRMRDCIDRHLGADPQLLSSPARRCLQTTAALGIGTPSTDPDLWEQDQGEWEGRPHADIPDLGPMTVADLARHRAPGGESFVDMTARVLPVLRAIASDTLIVAHAGTARAALSLVVGDAALSFAVAPLSLTLIDRHDTTWSVAAVNLTRES